MPEEASRFKDVLALGASEDIAAAVVGITLVRPIDQRERRARGGDP